MTDELTKWLDEVEPLAVGYKAGAELNKTRMSSIIIQLASWVIQLTRIIRKLWESNEFYSRNELLPGNRNYKDIWISDDQGDYARQARKEVLEIIPDADRI